MESAPCCDVSGRVTITPPPGILRTEGSALLVSPRAVVLFCFGWFGFQLLTVRKSSSRCPGGLGLSPVPLATWGWAVIPAAVRVTALHRWCQLHSDLLDSQILKRQQGQEHRYPETQRHSKWRWPEMTKKWETVLLVV